MNTDPLALTSSEIRGVDSNSLLRLYDRAQEMSKEVLNGPNRNRLDKALRRITQELEKRDVSV
jgi:hypothetical protein